MGGNHQPASGNRLIKRGHVLFGADAEIAQWVGRSIPEFVISPLARSLGVIKGGRIVAGIVFERCNGVHIEASISAVPGSKWADRETLRTIFGYPFMQLALEAVTVLVPKTNLLSLNLATKLGFKPIAFVPFAAQDGSPLVVLQMYRHECRWLKYGQGQQGTGGSGSVSDI